VTSSLLALLFPALALPLALCCPGDRSPLPHLLAPAAWPLELWVLAASGCVATLGGVLDWRYHQGGGRRIPAAEHRTELRALLLGVPLFALLVAASVIPAPQPLLLPIVVLALVMAGLVVHDETRFHRGCTRYETLLHRLLVGGNGIAFLAWLHWCFCRGGLGG